MGHLALLTPDHGFLPRGCVLWPAGDDMGHTNEHDAISYFLTSRRPNPSTTTHSPQSTTSQTRKPANCIRQRLKPLPRTPRSSFLHLNILKAILEGLRRCVPLSQIAPSSLRLPWSRSIGAVSTMTALPCGRQVKCHISP